ncbi:hypothetical protein EXIGLDRAFT_704271 [Exidia glandulosa HHB12029]|uniref:DUF1772-domain-containing protein n=1 Tax=Exidia glandulosa HHB12029 TaxID=1314781 RepID=A0A165BR81_EXIGL|nr:hypothetical protein EXIGLDRAFT_704271 [Exidia glandulosa HHB12029]
MPTVIQYIDGLRLVSTIGLGLVAGMTVCTSSMCIPAANATLPIQHRLAFWSQLYELGKAQIPALTAVSSLALAAAAYLAVPVPSLGFVGEHRREIMGGAAVLAISIIPYTVLVMMPGIHRLQELERRSKVTTPAPLLEQEADAGIRRWDTQHRVRAVSLTIAFALSVVEILIC